MEVQKHEFTEDRLKIALISSSNINKTSKKKIIATIKSDKELTTHQKKVIDSSNVSKEEKEFILEMGRGNGDEEEEQPEDSKGKEERDDTSNFDDVDESSEDENEERGERDFKMMSVLGTFDGDPSKARLWLQDFLYCARVNRWKHTLKAKRFPAFLKASERNWYQVSVMNTDIEFNFKEIKRQFELVFLPQSTRRAIGHEIEIKKQKAGEPVSNFIMDMRLLCKQYDSKMEDEEIIDKIKFRLLRPF